MPHFRKAGRVRTGSGGTEARLMTGVMILPGVVGVDWSGGVLDLPEMALLLLPPPPHCLLTNLLLRPPSRLQGGPTATAIGLGLWQSMTLAKTKDLNANPFCSIKTNTVSDGDRSVHWWQNWSPFLFPFCSALTVVHRLFKHCLCSLL